MARGSSSPASNTTAARLGRLEARFEGLEGDVHGIRKALERMEDRGERSRASPFQLLAALGTAVAIAAVVVRMGAGGYIAALERHELELNMAQASNVVAARELGRADARAEQLAKRLDDLEDLLRRHEGSRFTDSDGKDLRRELERKLEALRGAVAAHGADGHPFDVRARLDGLARRVELLEGIPRK